MQTATELQPQSEPVLLPVVPPNIVATETVEAEPIIDSTEPITEPAPPAMTVPANVIPEYCTAHLERADMKVPAYRLGLCKRCFEGHPINRRAENIVHPVGTVYSYSRRRAG